MAARKKEHPTNIELFPITFTLTSGSKNPKKKAKKKMKRRCTEDATRCPDALSAHMLRMYREDRLTDMTLMCRERVFRVHKAVAARSSYFRALIDHTAEPLHECVLHEMDPDMLRGTIEWLYTSEIGRPNTAGALVLLEASRFFQVNEMEMQCVQRLARCIQPDEAIMAWSYADRIGCDKVCNAALVAMGPSLPRLAATRAFLELSHGNVLTVLGAEALALNCEQAAYNAAMRWMRHAEARECAFGSLLGAVDMMRLPVAFLHDTVAADVVGVDDKDALRIFASTLRDQFSSIPSRARRNYGLSDALVLVGGDIDQPTAFIYDPESGLRSDLSPPVARRGCAAVVVDGSLCVFGGDTPGGITASGERFDPVARIWRRTKNMLSAKRDFAAVVHDGVLYVVGGIDDESDITRDASAYVVATGQWRRINSAKYVGGCAAVGVGDRVLVFGGDGGNEAFSISTGLWSDLPLASVKRTGVAAVLLDGLVYVLGGYGDHDANEEGDGVELAIAEVFDPASNAWSVIADMGLAREGVCAVAYNGYIYALGGNSTVSGDVAFAERYCPTTGQWSRMPDMPEARSYAGLVAL